MTLSTYFLTYSPKNLKFYNMFDIGKLTNYDRVLMLDKAG